MLKDILIHIDGSAADADRLAHAQVLTNWLDEPRLTAVFTNLLPDFVPINAVDAGALVDLEQQIRREGDHVEDRLKAQLNGPSCLREIRRIDDRSASLGRQVASLARCHDLFVASTPYRFTDYPTWGGVVEAVLFGGAGGTYLVPAKCPVRSELRTVLVAWKDTAEASRAIRMSLPLLNRATRVVLLGVDTDQEGDLAVKMSDMAAHLDRCGVTIDIRTVVGKDLNVGSLICAEAQACAADLIVMGAYGHSRLREILLGGATRSVIELSTLPIFLAH